MCMNLRKRKQKELLENEITILIYEILIVISPIVLNVLTIYIGMFNELIKTLIEITKKEEIENGK